MISPGEETEAIYLLFESGGPETDQPDVLMFKFSAGGIKIASSPQKEGTAFISRLNIIGWFLVSNTTDKIIISSLHFALIISSGGSEEF